MTEQLRAAREAFEQASTPAARSRAAQDLSDALAGRLLGERAFAFARDCLVSKKLSPWAESLWCELQLGELLNHTVDPARFTLRRALHGTLPEMRLHTVLRRLLAGGHGLRPHEAPWLIHGLLYHLYDHAPLATETEARGLVVLCLASARRGVPTELLAIVAQGFLLLTDLGPQTYLQSLREHDFDLAYANTLFRPAIHTLVRWQLASREGELPPYDEALLRRELSLFPDWYVERHLQRPLDAAQPQG